MTAERPYRQRLLQSFFDGTQNPKIVDHGGGLVETELGFIVRCTCGLFLLMGNNTVRRGAEEGVVCPVCTEWFAILTDVE